jgi:protein-tyrosine-phosphatase
MKKVLFVCTGNTCRSSMAQGFFNEIVDKNCREPNLYVGESAGIAACDGDYASYEAADVMKSEWGIDISSHRARCLTENIMNEAYLVLAMTRQHKAVMVSSFPQAKSKIFTLMEYAYGKNSGAKAQDYDYTLDIPDPYGMSRQVYLKCARQIKDAVEKLVGLIRR